MKKLISIKPEHKKYIRLVAGILILLLGVVEITVIVLLSTFEGNVMSRLLVCCPIVVIFETSTEAIILLDDNFEMSRRVPLTLTETVSLLKSVTISPSFSRIVLSPTKIIGMFSILASIMSPLEVVT